MDIWLIYIVKTLILPVSSLLILSFCGCYFVLKHDGKGSFFLLAPLFLLFLLSLPVVAMNLANIQQRYKAIDFSVFDKLDLQAIVVIGGGSQGFAPEYGAGKTVNARTLLRLRYTAKLAKKTKLPVLVSGGTVLKQKFDSEANLMAAVLNDEFNVPVQWLETQSRNTAENALLSYELLAKEKVKRIVLVTHSMHMRRAAEQFRRVGFEVLPAPTIFSAMVDLTVLSFLPSVQALEISTSVIHEWMGILWYRIRY